MTPCGAQRLTREPGFESSCCHFENLSIAFSPRCRSSVSCINEYLQVWNLFMYSFIRLNVYFFIRLFIYYFIHSFECPSLPTTLHSFLPSFPYPTIPSSVNPPSFRPPVRPSNHPLICPQSFHPYSLLSYFHPYSFTPHHPPICVPPPVCVCVCVRACVRACVCV